MHERGVRVRVDESGENNSTATINLCDIGIALQPCVFRGFLSSADGDDFPASTKNRSVFNNAKVVQFAATAWRMGIAKSEELRNVGEKQGRSVF
jgi:hypothetical protein